MPVHVTDRGWKVVQGLKINNFSKAKISATVAELKEEAAAVADLIKS